MKQFLRGINLIKPKIDYEIIIVDNASSDGSQKFLEEWKQRIAGPVKFILNKKNIGLAAALNLGVKKAEGKYLLILNPDVVVLENSIEKLYQFMEKNPQVGVCGPKLLNPDRSIQPSCYRFPKWYIPILRRTFLGQFSWAKKKIDYYLMADFDHQVNKEVDWLLGACLMIRKEALEEIGFFDERFFLYFEDVDLCRKMKLHGWRVVYLAQSEMFHYYQRASAEQEGFYALFSKTTWIHIFSAIKYFFKWRKDKNQFSLF
ncbi:MAG: glycosyltransferase family 2 protein [Patescibacteria group bacterium]|nr:glycosyltransferase family 2 protein [Patescibacteria group bacterium]